MTSSTKIIIALVLLVAVAAGGIFWVTSSNNDDSTKSASSTQENKTASKSLDQLRADGGNQKCSFSYKDESGNSTSGTVYIAGERLRGDFVVVTSSQPEQQTHMIIDSKSQYMWTDGSADGVKYSLSSLEAAESSSDDPNAPPAGQQNQVVDENQAYDFDCDKWSVDSSVFKPPADVNFTDFSAQLQQVQNSQAQGCASITDPASRAACEQAIQQ